MVSKQNAKGKKKSGHTRNTLYSVDNKCNIPDGIYGAIIRGNSLIISGVLWDFFCGLRSNKSTKKVARKKNSTVPRRRSTSK